MKLTDEQLKKVQEFWSTFDKKKKEEELSPFENDRFSGHLSFGPQEKEKAHYRCAELKPVLLEKLGLMEECLRIFRDSEVPRELRMLSLALVCLTLEEQAGGLRFFVESALGEDNLSTELQ